MENEGKGEGGGEGGGWGGDRQRTRQVNAQALSKLPFGDLPLKNHWEIKGRFRKRVVLANVPSFRFSFRGNIRRNHPFGNHPFVNTRKGHWEIKGRFPKGWFWRTYPRSGFRSGGTSAKTTLLETTLLSTPEKNARQHRAPRKGGVASRGFCADEAMKRNR